MFQAMAPGFLLTLALGVGAYFVSTLHDAADALVVALLLGMVVRQSFGKSPRFFLVVAYAKDMQRYLIPAGLALYAATIEVHKAIVLPRHLYGLTLLAVAILFVVPFVVGRALGMSKKTTWLTAAGSAICGASAVAVVATGIDADDDEVSSALVAVTAVGLAALGIVVGLPSLLPQAAPEAVAALAGATLQQTGLVKIAGATLGGALGAELALPIKVVRIALLPVVALGLSAWALRRDLFRGQKLYFAAVLVLFAALLGASSFVPALAGLAKLKGIKIAATILFATAVANLGLLVDFARLSWRPLVAVGIAWAAAASVFWVLV